MNVFPSDFSAKWEKLNLPREWKSYLKYFICSICNGKVTFECHPETDLKQIIRHFKYTLDGVDCECEDKIYWEKVYKHLHLPTHSSLLEKRNTHQNLLFRCGNVFLTKKFFTFGHLKTGAGECHVYQIGKFPLLYYKLKHPFTHQEPTLGTFKWEDEQFYEPFKLLPNTNYYVPENTSYLIIIENKALFRVDKYRTPVTKVEGIVGPLKSPTDTPLKKRKFKGSDEAYPSKARKHLDFQAAEIPLRVIQDRNSINTQGGNSLRDQTLDRATMNSTENFYGTFAGQPHSSREDMDQSGSDILRVNQLESTPNNNQPMSQMINNGQDADESTSDSYSSYEPETILTENDNQPVLASEPADQPAVERGTYDLPLNSMAEGQRASLHDTSELPRPLSANPPHLEEAHPVFLQDISEFTNTPNGDLPRPFEKVDNSGNRYLVQPVDMNWVENDTRPLEAWPKITKFNGRYFINVPIKL